MKKQKIRGHKGVWKEIGFWRDENLELDLDYLKATERAYVKIAVSPFLDYSLLNSELPEPRGKTRKLILESLLDIYDSWKQQLERLDEPYYLKLWLYDPRFTNSQVVCAIGNALDFYKLTFFKPETKKQLKVDSFGKLKGRMQDFQWEYALDEVHLSSRDIGTPEEFYSYKEYEKNKREIGSRLKKPHRKLFAEDENGEVTEFYSFKRGTVWLGEK